MNRRGRRPRVVARRGETRGLSVAEENHATAESKSASSGAGLSGGRDDDGRTAEGRKELYGFLEIAGENAQRGATAGAGAMGEDEVGTERRSEGRAALTHRGPSGRRMRALTYFLSIKKRTAILYRQFTHKKFQFKLILKFLLNILIKLIKILFLQEIVDYF